MKWPKGLGGRGPHLYVGQYFYAMEWHMCVSCIGDGMCMCMYGSCACKTTSHLLQLKEKSRKYEKIEVNWREIKWHMTGHVPPIYIYICVSHEKKQDNSFFQF